MLLLGAPRRFSVGVTERRAAAAPADWIQERRVGLFMAEGDCRRRANWGWGGYRVEKTWGDGAWRGYAYSLWLVWLTERFTGGVSQGKHGAERGMKKVVVQFRWLG